MHVWVDYMCMPQLTCVKREEVITHTDTHQSSEKPSRSCQDHSKNDSDDSKLLALAVKSLPAYVEMCWSQRTSIGTGQRKL